MTASNVGPAGPTGAAGAAGAAGATGAVGADGAVGQTGNTGNAGNTGMQGTPGLPGLPGEVGPTGEDGVSPERAVMHFNRKLLVAFLFAWFVVGIMFVRSEAQHRDTVANATRIEHLTYDLRMANYQRCVSGLESVKNLNDGYDRLAQIDRDHPVSDPEAAEIQAARIMAYEQLKFKLPPGFTCGPRPAKPVEP